MPARPLRHVRRQDSQRAMGTAGQWLHAAVRGVGHDHALGDAGQSGGRIVGEHDTRPWRVVHHYADQARERADASGVTRLAIDETAARRGHDYVTLFVDIDRARVVFATEARTPTP